MQVSVGLSYTQLLRGGGCACLPACLPACACVSVYTCHTMNVISKSHLPVGGGTLRSLLATLAPWSTPRLHGGAISPSSLVRLQQRAGGRVGLFPHHPEGGVVTFHPFEQYNARMTVHWISSHGIWRESAAGGALCGSVGQIQAFAEEPHVRWVLYKRAH